MKFYTYFWNGKQINKRKFIEVGKLLIGQIKQILTNNISFKVTFEYNNVLYTLEKIES